MSQIDQSENMLSEATDGQKDSGIVNSERLVPVGESIRYRKRAQSAEKEIEILTEQLSQARSQKTEATEQLNSIKTEQQLSRKLAAAGAIDLETAVLIVKTRIEGEPEADLDACIDRLRKEKQYLFEKSSGAGPAVQKTASAKERTADGAGFLERAAKKAATTGNRTDLQEYLKLRRNFV